MIKLDMLSHSIKHYFGNQKFYDDDVS